MKIFQKFFKFFTKIINFWAPGAFFGLGKGTFIRSKFNFRGGQTSKIFCLDLPFPRYKPIVKIVQSQNLNPCKWFLTFTQKLGLFKGNFWVWTLIYFLLENFWHPSQLCGCPWGPPMAVAHFYQKSEFGPFSPKICIFGPNFTSWTAFIF